MIPTAHIDKSRVRTGYERVVAQYCGRQFAGVAEKDGTITKIDPSTNVIEVTYKDGSVDIYTYGEKYTEHESVNTTDNLECNVQLGQKVKAGDVICYDKNFFFRDKHTGQVDFSIGVMTNTVLMETDTTLEDAICISKSLSEKMAITPTNTRVVNISRNSLVYKCVKVGDEVGHTDKLMIFEENVALGEGEEDPLNSFKGDEETLAMLGELNRRTPTAKFAGKVVKIEAYYGSSISSMHPSVQKIVKDAISVDAQRALAAKETLAENEFPAPKPVPIGTKIKGVTIEEDTVMLIFYIQERMPMQVGDKSVLGLQLKHTVSSIMQQPQYTGDGEEIDAIFSADAIGRRIVLSATFIGIMNRLLERIEKNVIEMYDKSK